MCLRVEIPMIATGRVDTCTRDSEEEFQGRVDASKRGFLVPNIAERRSSAFNIG